jgi:hypothetical protein
LVELSSEIQPQLVRQSFVVDSFVEEVAPVGVVEVDLENVVVVDFRTVLRTELLLECRLLVENLPVLKLLAFWMGLDALSD